MSVAQYAWLTILLPLVGAVVNGAIALRRPAARSAVTIIGPGVLLLSFAVAVASFIDLRQGGGPVRIVLWDWMSVTGGLSIPMALLVDQLSVIMLLVVTGVGSLIHIFSVGYMRADPGYARYFSYLNLFVACMLVLVLGASLPVSFIGWEGVGLCSYLLIGFWFEIDANAGAGKKAFLMNRIGDFGVLLAMFLLWWTVGTLDYAAITVQVQAVLPFNSLAALAIALLLFLGCAGKSAQIPLYTWLPDAMAGPTPVSALIHAATMVTAGVFLVVRTGVVFAVAPVAMEVVALVGAVTAFFAATIALRQNDIKKVLAYSTVSQLGYMFLAVGTGAWTAGIFHLMTHAFFKALLFLGAGSVIHAMHEGLHHAHRHDDAQDMRNMGGLRRKMPWTFALMTVATLAIAG
ncbi:MAG TPA: NADH-quinone oxidoreductase subunit L, partial [Gemmatimonadales bacterium]|nr:NADH-quinone oxidoreductase subunit L [Gemmatimonadales bacterium]